MFNHVDSLGLWLSQASVWVKIGFFFLGWSVLWLPIALPIAKAVQWKPPAPLEVRQKLPLVLSLYLLAPFVLWGMTTLQGQPFSTYGVNGTLDTLRSFGLGFGLGAIGLLLMFGVQFGLGWLRWNQGSAIATALIPTLLLGVIIGAVEELVFRGFLFGQLMPVVGFWSAAIASSLIFAVLHLVWEGADRVPQLPGLTLMGVVLCFAVVADLGQLGLAWGLHAGWIWVMATQDAAEPKSSGTGPDWLTGLDGQPLAGFLGLGFLLATAGVVLAL